MEIEINVREVTIVTNANFANHSITLFYNLYNVAIITILHAF